MNLLAVLGALVLTILVTFQEGGQQRGRAQARPRATLRAGAAPDESWHRGDSLICSDCHTIHNSQGGAPMRYDGSPAAAPRLLRMADEVQLCLYCHDGSNPLAPDVLHPVTYVTDPAGGGFELPSTPNPNGHDLASLTPLPSPGSSESFVLRCSSCHDLHGSHNYRNLLVDPPGSADDGQVDVIVDQLVLPNGSNPSQVYVQSNLLDREGMGEFCNSCHDNFHGKTLSEEGGTQRPWLRHPQEVTIFGSDHADYGHWSSSLSNRVRVETPLDDLIPSADDRVNCLSCHKAHGSDRPDSLIFADGLRRRSTCQQCHNQ